MIGITKTLLLKFRGRVFGAIDSRPLRHAMMDGMHGGAYPTRIHTEFAVAAKKTPAAAAAPR